MNDADFFISLSRWARGKEKSQEENFTSEILTGILKVFSENSQNAIPDFVKMLTKETNFKYYDNKDFWDDLKIICQYYYCLDENTKIPDICIESKHLLLFIEVKIGAQESGNQRKDYAEYLKTRKDKKVFLAYLTDPFVSPTESPFEDIPYKHIYWDEIVKILDNRCPKDDDVSLWLKNEFKKYLIKKELIVKKVNKEIMKVGPEVSNFLNMIKHAMAQVFKRKITESRATLWGGSKTRIRNLTVWIGFIFNAPQKLFFQIESVPNPKITPPTEAKWHLEDLPYTKGVAPCLDLEKNGFFEKSEHEQVNIIVNFIQEVKEQVENL